MANSDDWKPGRLISGIMDQVSEFTHRQRYRTEQAREAVKQIDAKEKRLIDKAKEHLDAAIKANEKPPGLDYNKAVDQSKPIPMVKRKNAPSIPAQKIYTERVKKIESAAKNQRDRAAKMRPGQDRPDPPNKGGGGIKPRPPAKDIGSTHEKKPLRNIKDEFNKSVGNSLAAAQSVGRVTPPGRDKFGRNVNQKTTQPAIDRAERMGVSDTFKHEAEPSRQIDPHEALRQAEAQKVWTSAERAAVAAEIARTTAEREGPDHDLSRHFNHGR